MAYTFLTINDGGHINHLTLSNHALFRTIPTLQKRDLTFINNHFLFKISSILTKNKTILIKLDHIRCIIYDKVAYFVVPDNDGGTINFQLNTLTNNIRDSLSNNTTTKFKLKILEEIFIIIAEQFETEILDIAPKISIITNILADNDVSVSLTFRNFVDLHHRLLNLHLRLEDIFDLFEDLSPSNKENNDNLKNNIEHDTHTISSFDDLIEHYSIRFEHGFSDTKQMLHILNTLLQVTNLNLDHIRNKMTMFNIYLNLFMISLAIGSLLVGIFGMNVPNFLEQSNAAFPIIITVVIIFIIISFILNKFIKKIII